MDRETVGEKEDTHSFLPSRLDDAQIPGLPEGMYYIPNFITKAEEDTLVKEVLTQPTPRWTNLTHRRLQTHPSPLSPRTNTLLNEPLPPFLTTPIIPRFSRLQVFASSPHCAAPNHVLINEYTPGQGIMPHEDGAAYWPTVATVSLGAHIVLDVYAKGADGERGELRARILQERRSLLVTRGVMYTDFLHGIAEVELDERLQAGMGEEGITNWDILGEMDMWKQCEGRKERETRISLTYRDVLRVKNMGKGLKGILGRR
ncbi:MAG: hypothetical protein M1834_009728 [Cirrosporium novae-zelandiae]|nr:MAG: hypothetical protein M1834_009728 [Cirrosporium novae-zelandiae]